MDASLLLVALLQTELADMIIGISWQLLILTGVVGIATTFIMQLAQKGSTWLNKKGPQVKRILTTLVATVLESIGAIFGVTMPQDLAGLDTVTLTGLAAGLFSMGLYQVLKLLGVKGFKKPKTT